MRKRRTRVRKKHARVILRRPPVTQNTNTSARDAPICNMHPILTITQVSPQKRLYLHPYRTSQPCDDPNKLSPQSTSSIPTKHAHIHQNAIETRAPPRAVTGQASPSHITITPDAPSLAQSPIPATTALQGRPPRQPIYQHKTIYEVRRLWFAAAPPRRSSTGPSAGRGLTCLGAQGALARAPVAGWWCARVVRRVRELCVKPA